MARRWGDPMYNWQMHDWMNGWWPMGGLFWFAIVALVAYGAYAYGRRDFGINSSPGDTGSAALRALDERYAKGEIDREDYLRRKRDILGNS
jgi:putative membrane protein